MLLRSLSSRCTRCCTVEHKFLVTRHVIVFRITTVSLIFCSNSAVLPGWLTCALVLKYSQGKDAQVVSVNCWQLNIPNPWGLKLHPFILMAVQWFSSCDTLRAISLNFGKWSISELSCCARGNTLFPVMAAISRWQDCLSCPLVTSASWGYISRRMYLVRQSPEDSRIIEAEHQWRNCSNLVEMSRHVVRTSRLWIRQCMQRNRRHLRKE